MKRQVEFSIEEVLKLISQYVLDKGLLGDTESVSPTLVLDTAGKAEKVVVEEVCKI